MNSDERVRKILNHEETDRVPLDLGGWQSGINYTVYEGLKQLLGIKKELQFSEIIQGLAVVDEEVLERYHIDTRYVFQNPGAAGDKKNPFDLPEDYFIGEWGIRWERPVGCYYYEMRDRPLSSAETVQEIDNYSWPDPLAILPEEELERKAKKIKDSEYSLFTSTASVFEQSTYIRGMDEFFIDIAVREDLFEAIMENVLNVLLPRYSKFLGSVGKYLDLIEFYLDLGTQIGPMISPEFYRNKIKKYEIQLVDLVKNMSNAKVCIHSCGAVSDFIPDIIETGYEVLNPVQTTAKGMDGDFLKKKFGNEISFWGGIDTQKVLPFGTVDEVKDEVKRKIDAFAPGGGYVLAPCHNIQALTPVKNVIALFETAYEYGKY